MRPIWFALALALVGCHGDASSEDPAERTQAWCSRVHDLFTWLDAPIVKLEDELRTHVDPSMTPALACELASREMTGMLHGFAIGMDAPDLKTADTSNDAFHDLAGTLIHTLGEGCNPVTGGSPELAIPKVRAALAQARATIAACPR